MPAPKRSPVPTPRPFRDVSPEAERGDQDLMRALEADEAAGAIERGNRAAQRYAEDEMDVKKFNMGGEVRGCHSSQVSGKGFKGTF